MNEPSTESWDGEADEGDDIVHLVQQGLLPLPMRSILTARLVCKQWHKNIGCLLSQITLPYDAWSGSSDCSSASPVLQRSRHLGTTPAKTVAGAAGALEDEELEDTPATAADTDDVWMPPFPCHRASKRQRSGLLALPKRQRHEQQKQKQQKQPLEYGSDTEQHGQQHQVQPQQKQPRLLDDLDTEQLQQKELELDIQQEQQQQQQQRRQQQDNDEELLDCAMETDEQHVPQMPRQQLTAECELLDDAMDKAQQHTQCELQKQHAGAKSPSPPQSKHTAAAAAANTPVPAAAAATSGAAGSTAASAGQHPLQRVPSSFPCTTQVMLLCRHRSSSASERAAPCFAKLATSLQILGQLPKLHTLVVKGSLPRPMWQPLLAGLQQDVHTDGHAQLAEVVQQLQPQRDLSFGLQQRLVCLQLVGCDMPSAEVLEGLVSLHALRELVLHASIKSPALQPDHLEALSTGSQLESLSLSIYQIGLGGNSRLQLNPLLELTNLRSLDFAYKGIFNDQRPHFRTQDCITALQRLTSFSTAGLASPLIPVPALKSLLSYSAVGNNRRLGQRALATIGSCSSIKSLKIEAGRRGGAAVAAEHLHYLGLMKQLTSLTLSLSKGGQAASKSTQQLLQLNIPGLKVFAVGSGDHRIAIRTEQSQELAALWPQLESLRLSSVSPLQGLAGLGAFTSLQALSLKPGSGTGKLLLELQAALEPLQQLKRLHLDFRSSLTLEHVQAVAAACADRLQHLSLNMRGSSIGSKAVEYIAQLTCLTSLQLLGTGVKTFVGPPAAAALASMQGLRWLSIQAVEEQLGHSPIQLGCHLWNGLQALTQLRELRVWLGSGVEGRHAQEALVRKAEARLYDCRCYALQEPEKPVL